MRAGWLLLLAATPCAAQTYDAALVPAGLQGSPATMTPLKLGDDSTAKVDFGFQFPYFGQTFDSAWVSSNGFISFDTRSPLCCEGVSLEFAPRNTIYGLWLDLIDYSGNPYYARKDGSILFGWYGTREYATQNKYTFEINLSATGDIQFNYGNLPPLTYHTATAGITGPNIGDNYQLFFGTDPRPLSFQSGVLSLKKPPSVDCNSTPMDPSCPPIVAQTVSEQPVATIQQAAAADMAADTAEVAAATVPEPAQEISNTRDAAPSKTDVSTPAERLSPEQIASLSADQTVVITGLPQLVFQPQTTPQTAAGVFEAASTSFSQTSVANTIEALNMASAAVAVNSASQGSQTPPDSQSATMEAMASVPGFSAYLAVSLRDRPDFYAPRDIYRNRRLRDANFEMYRMTRTSSDAWQEMVDEQYRR